MNGSRPKQEQNKYFIKFIWNLITPYRGRLALGALSIWTINGLEMIPPLVFKMIADKIQGGSFDYNPWLLSGFFIFLYFLMALLRWVWRWCFFVTSRHIESDIKNIIFEKILNTSFSQASKLKVGNTVSLFSQDANEIRWFVGIVGLLIFDTGSYLFYIPFVLVKNLGAAGLMLMLPFLVIPPLMYWYEKKMNILFERSSDRLGKVADWVYEETVGVKVLRVLSLYKHRRSKYGEVLQDILTTHQKIGQIDVIFDSIFSLLVYFSRAILFVCAFIAISQKDIFLAQFALLGNIIMVMRVLDRLVGPMASFGEMATLTEKAKAATRRMRPVLDLVPETSGVKVTSTPIEQIKLVDLNFSYPSEIGTAPQVLKNVSFDLLKGQKIGIVGAVGSGKSTLLKILSGLYPDKEIDRVFEFSINNVAFRNLSLPDYKQHVSYLPQESVIFNSSIFSNIAPEGNKSRQEVMNVVDLAALAQDLKTFPEGLETPIGEKGLNLSGGQKQRVALARSFLSGAHLFLWDDVISALDIETERKVVSNIFHINPNAILVLATHRPSALVKFDKIYVMKGGSVSESGTFNDLMNRRGDFYELYQYEARTREIGVEGERI